MKVKSIRNLLEKLKNIFALIVIALLLLLYFGVFAPLKMELETSLENNFRNLVSISEQNVENYLDRSLESVNSLSSRTMIKNKLESHVNGDLGINELRDYTQPKYADGVKVLDNAVSAYRLCSEHIVAHFGEEKLSLINSYDFDELKNQEIKIDTEKNYIINKSTIIDDSGNRLGLDFIIIDFENIMDNINDGRIDYSIIRSMENPQKTAVQKNDDGLIVEYRKLLATDYWLKAEMPSGILYDNLNTITTQIVLAVLFAVFLISAAVIKSLESTSQELVKELKEDLKEKTEMAEKDDLLDIYNRNKFREEIQKEMERASRYGSKLSLIMFDIDYFKEINDNHGHKKGDQILIQIVNMVKAEIRKQDILARYGGDEFLLLCPESSADESFQLAERLRDSIDNYESRKIDQLSCSFGVTSYDAENDDSESFIQRADAALYKAKELGRNKVCRK